MKLKPVIPILLICLLFCTYAFSQRIQKEGLPSDYNCAGCILVILKKEHDQNIHNMNEMVEKKLIKNYDGKSIFVTATALNTDSMYADTNIYRFLLNGEPYSIPGSRPVTKASGSPGTFNYTVTPLKFQLYDRVTKKWYPQITSYASWPKTMEKVAAELNKLLKK